MTSANSCQAAREGKGQSLAGRVEREAVSPKPVTPDRQWPHWTEPRGNLSILPRGAAPGPTAQHTVAPPPSGPPVSLLASCAPRPASLQRQEGLAGLRRRGECPHCWHPSLTPQTGRHASGEVSFWYQLGPQTCSQSTHPPHCLPPTTQTQKNGDQRERGQACSQMLAPPHPPPPQLRARPSPESREHSLTLIQILHGWGAWDRSHRPPKRHSSHPREKEASGKMLPPSSGLEVSQPWGHLSLGSQPLLLRAQGLRLPDHPIRWAHRPGW